MPEPLQRLQVSGFVPGGTPAPPKIGNCEILSNELGKIECDHFFTFEESIVCDSNSISVFILGEKYDHTTSFTS